VAEAVGLGEPEDGLGIGPEGLDDAVGEGVAGVGEAVGEADADGAWLDGQTETKATPPATTSTIAARASPTIKRRFRLIALQSSRAGPTEACPGRMAHRPPT
jgi:hypothetical protein